MRITARAAFAMVCLLVVPACLCVAGPAFGADASPSVSVILTGSGELLSDTEYLLKLTDKTEQKQYKVLKDYIGVFLIGVDQKLPTAIEVLFGDKEDRYVWSVPVQNMQQFNKNNIQAILTTRVKQVQPGLFKLGSGRKDDFNGYMLYSAPYAHIGDRQQDVSSVPSDPRPGLAALLARNFAVAVEVRNQKVDAASQSQRREIFKGTRKSTLAALKKEKGETAAQFDLRKKAVDVQMDEAELFFADSAQALVGVTLDQKKGQGRVDIELTPIAESALAKAVSLLGQKASYFANIEKAADPILSARLNHPLTEMRKKDALAMASLSRDGLKARTDADQKLSADQKTATNQLVEKTFELFEAGIKEGQADGFIDVHKGSSGKNILLAGLRTPGGAKIEEILNLVPKAGAGTSVSLNVGEESGAKIHSVALSKDQHPHWNEFIGADSLYVAASKDAVWCAAGEGALEAMKAAIKKATQPAPAGAEKAPWAELVVKLKPWIEQTAELPKKKGEGTYRKLALSAFEQGDDQLSVQMTQQNGKIIGEIIAQKGLLRFAGKAAAQFSKENLDNDAPQKGPRAAGK